MKTMMLMLLMVQSTLLLAAADKPNPADFTVKVHVISSGTLLVGSATDVQVLEAVIDNQAVELRATNSPGLLALGDYPARLLAGWQQPKHPNSYDIYRAYDLLMADGAKRTFVVTRLGPAPSHP